MKNELNYTALGEKIRAERKKAKLTQEQLGEICSLSASYIGHIERGTRIASLETVFNIAATLGVSIDSLISDSLPANEASLQSIGAMLKGKNPQSVQSFIAAARALAENIDNL